MGRMSHLKDRRPLGRRGEQWKGLEEDRTAVNILRQGGPKKEEALPCRGEQPHRPSRQQCGLGSSVI